MQSLTICLLINNLIKRLKNMTPISEKFSTLINTDSADPIEQIVE